MAKVRLLSKIRRFLGGKPKAPPPYRYAGEGHRGIAAGDMQERYRRIERGEQPYTQEEIEKWKPISRGEVEDFLYNEGLLFVHSSNVVAAQYFPKEQKMMVEFKGGRAYLYSSVSQFDAVQFVQYMSKGSFVWDNFRIRGSRTAHKKPFLRLK